MSKVIKMEYEVFEKNRIKEFKVVVTSYLEALAQHQVQVSVLLRLDPSYYVAFYRNFSIFLR